MNDCEMCGVATGRLDPVIVEGSLLQLCQRCKTFGNSVVLEQSNVTSYSERPRIPRKIYVEESVSFVIEGAGLLIKQAREKRNVHQKDFAKMAGLKASMIHKIEANLMKPDLRTAQKIERILDIHIVENYEDSDARIPFNLHDGDLTVGDLVKFKKRN